MRSKMFSIKCFIFYLIRLRDIYDLYLDHVLEGRMLGLVAVHCMRASECFFMANVAYKTALMPDEFQAWYKTCQTVSTNCSSSSLWS